jgi:cytochrome P450
MLPFGRGAPDANYLCNPYPALDHLRETRPRLFDAQRNAWFISTHRDVSALLRDDRLTITRGTSFADQSPAFRSSIVRRLRVWFASPPPVVSEVVSRVVDTCLNRIVDGGEVDLVETVAQAIPAAVMADLLGIPASDLPELQRLVGSRLLSYDLAWDGRPVESRLAPAFLDAYFQRHLRIAPDTALMHLLRRVQADEGLPDESLVDTCSKLFSAGTTTTAGCLANILAHLSAAAHGRNAALPGDTGPDAVDAHIRLHTPVLALKRRASDTIPIADGVIEPGHDVYLLVASANRDPDAFPSQECPHQSDARHLAFGHGRYHCLGAPLARLEVAHLLNRVSPVLSRVRVTRPVLWREAWFIHEALSVRVAMEGRLHAQ